MEGEVQQTVLLRGSRGYCQQLMERGQAATIQGCGQVYNAQEHTPTHPSHHSQDIAHAVPAHAAAFSSN